MVKYNGDANVYWLLSVFVSDPSKYMYLYSDLTHCGLVMPYGNIHLGQHCTCNGLLPDGTRPLPEPMLIYHQRGPVTFI